MSFLEPNHDHDPTCVVHLIEPPKTFLSLLPDNVVEILAGVQDSTSIAYSSKERFDELIADRFDRLLPDHAANDAERDKENIDPAIHEVVGAYSGKPRRPSYSEPAFFHYQNQVMAEKRYLTKEALVDWHNKVHRLEREIHMLHLSEADDQRFHTWLNALKREVIHWEEHAEDIDVPEFEDTIAEFELQQAGDSTKKAAITEDKPTGSVAMEKTDSGIGM